MQRAVTILSIIAVLCMVGVVIAVRLYIAASNARKTERARAQSIENKAKRAENKEYKQEQKQTELFGADDVNELTDDK